MAWLLIVGMAVSVSGCGSAGKSGLTDAAQNRASLANAAGDGDGTQAGDGAGAESNPGRVAETGTDTVSPSYAETADLLEISFFAAKDEAISAAGGHAVEIVDTEPTEYENPLGWCYMVYTALRDDMEVKLERGHDTLTQGDPIGGFEPSYIEAWDELDKGDSVVAYVNIEWYPIFELVAQDDAYKGRLPLGWDIYTSRDDNDGIPADTALTGQRLLRPIHVYKTIEDYSSSDMGDEYASMKYGYGSKVEYFTTDSKHKALKARLDNLAEETRSGYEEAMGMFGLDAREAYDSSTAAGTGDYVMYRHDLSVSLCRADDLVFSFVEYGSADLGGTRYSTAFGRNIYTDTGEDVDLKDIITDTGALIDALYDRCDGYGFEDNVRDAFCEVVKGVADTQDTLISDEYFSWNICYEGLWLHFGDTVPADILYSAQGRNSVFLPFREYPDLFVPRFLNVPDAYTYDIENDDALSEYYALDLDRDGYYEEFALRAHDKNGWIEALDIDVDSAWDSISDGIDCASCDTFIVHTDAGLDYLYVSEPGAEEYGAIAVYQLSEEVHFEDLVEGNVCDLYMFCDHDGADPGADIEMDGMIMTDPSNFILTKRDNKLGSGICFAYHETARNGAPLRKDDCWTYCFDGEWRVKPRDSINLAMVNEYHEIIGYDVLDSDTYIRPYQTDDWDYVDVTGKAGTVWRINIVMSDTNEYGILIDGQSPDEVFSGAEIRWG